MYNRLFIPQNPFSCSLQATAELQLAFKNPEAIPALCQVAVSSSEPQHRQYSAVLLTKRLGKLRNWQLVAPEQQEQ